MGILLLSQRLKEPRETHTEADTHAYIHTDIVCAEGCPTGAVTFGQGTQQPVVAMKRENKYPNLAVLPLLTVLPTGHTEAEPGNADTRWRQFL